MHLIAPARLTRLMVIGILGGVLLMTLGLVVYESLRVHKQVLEQQQEAQEVKLERYRQRLKYEAESMQDNLLYRFNKAETLVREMSREQVDAAHAIATNIYTSAKDELPEEQIKALIVEALRDIRFFQDRGYIFIDNMHGKCILLPTNPELEGSSQWDKRDDAGTYLVRGLIEAASNPAKRGYASYRWYRPDLPDLMAEKIAYVRQFEPYNWLIGGGDYIYQVENDLRKEVLARIESLKLPHDGYLVVLDKEGRLFTSSSSAKDIGRLPEELTNPHQQKLVNRLLKVAEQGGGPIEYEWYRPGYEGLHTKLAYVVQSPGTGWVLVATGYRAAVLGDAAITKNWLNSFIEELPILLLPLLVIGLITLLIALMYARWLGRLLKHYQLNITEQQGRLQVLAERDPLTDLPNRWLMGQELLRAMDKAVLGKYKLALIVIDIDRFKNINDSLGHALGDKVLQELGSRMEACVEQKSFVARMGGDEFVLLIEPANNYKALTILAQSLLKQINKPIIIEDHRLVVTASIGVALYPEHGINQDTLLRHADIAMYQAKARGRNRYCFYSRAMGEQVIDRLQLEKDLAKAIEKEEGLYLLYQPQWDLRTGKIIGCEALLRWRHPIRGLIHPLEFIPLAEETGLIQSLGDWVLRSVLAQASSWQAQGLPAISMAVNLSTAQLNANLPKQIKKLLEVHQLPASLLELEVTETLLMTAQNEAITILSELKATGVRIALDDFGTGYSSLSYLSRLPLNLLKIDKSFVDGLPNRKDDVVIAQLIIRMADELDIITLAEGVETQEQLDFLKEAGCHLIQGYLLARPLPPEEVAALLRKV